MGNRRIVGGALLIASVPMGLLEAWHSLSLGTDETELCGVASILVSIMALVGGVNALLGKDYNTAMVGAVLACLTGGPFFVGTALGIAGAVLVGVSREEFQPPRTDSSGRTMAMISWRGRP